MNKNNIHINHFAWCALVALNLARQDGVITSSAQENLYLTRWIALAQKQKRFSYEVAGDINWLLKEGRKFGIRADLPGMLEYLWRDTKGDLNLATDLFRLQHALHGLQLGGWIYKVLSEAEWENQQHLHRITANSGLYVSINSLESSFDKMGNQKAPISAYINGSLPALNSLLIRANWRCEKIYSKEQLEFHLIVA